MQRQVNGLKEVRVGSTNRFAKRSIPEDEITFPLEWLWNQKTFPVAFEKVNGLIEYFLELLRSDRVTDLNNALQSAVCVLPLFPWWSSLSNGGRTSLF